MIVFFGKESAMQPQDNGHRPLQKSGTVVVIQADKFHQRANSDREQAAMYTREREQRRYNNGNGMDYPALLDAIRNELQPLQHDVAELSQQMRGFEGRYYPRELIDAQNALQKTILEGLRNDIANLASRPAQTLNNWVAWAVIGGGFLGVLSFVFQHLALH